LNKLPEVKRFVKEPGHADGYEGLKIKYNPGQSPELVCFRDDKEVERVDLTLGQTTEQLHTLMQEKGLKKKLVGEGKEEL